MSGIVLGTGDELVSKEMRFMPLQILQIIKKDINQVIMQIDI